MGLLVCIWVFVLLGVVAACMAVSGFADRFPPVPDRPLGIKGEERMEECTSRRVFTCVTNAEGYTGGKRNGADGIALSCDMEDALDLEEGDIVKVTCAVLKGHRRVMSWERDRYPKPECAKYYDEGANSFEESDGSGTWGPTEEYYVPESFQFKAVIDKTRVKKVLLVGTPDGYRVSTEMDDDLIVEGKLYKKEGTALKRAAALAREIGCDLSVKPAN